MRKVLHDEYFVMASSAGAIRGDVLSPVSTNAALAEEGEPLDTRETLAAGAVGGGDGRPKTIAMVLPRPEQNNEIAFQRYLTRHRIPTNTIVIPFSGRQEALADLIMRVRQVHPDLIYSWGTPTTMALAGRFDAPTSDGHIRDIPIVFTDVTDPVGVGLLPTLDKPHRNVTGVPHIAPLATQLSVLRSYRPFVRMGFIDNPEEPNSALLLDKLSALAPALGMQILSERLDAPGRDESMRRAIAVKIASLKARGAQILYIGATTLLAFTYRDFITDAALKADLPTFCTTESILRQSHCLFGIFSNGSNVGEFAGFKARRILIDGVSAGDIPATPLQRFSIVINLPVAKRLNLFPPLSLLQRAEVIPIGCSSMPPSCSAGQLGAS